MQNKQGYLYFIPSLLAESGEPTKALLFGLVASLSNKEGFCWASNKYLAAKLRLKSVTQIKTYLKELTKEGWLKVEIVNNSKRRLRPFLTNPVNLLTGGGQSIDQGGSEYWPPIYLSNKTSKETSNKKPITSESIGGKEKESCLGGKERGNGEVGEFWDYFLLKTKRRYHLNYDKCRMIRQGLKEHGLVELKRCVDAFVIDDWTDRKKYTALKYCIGKTETIEKWLNMPSKKVVRYV